MTQDEEILKLYNEIKKSVEDGKLLLFCTTLIKNRTNPEPVRQTENTQRNRQNEDHVRITAL